MNLVTLAPFWLVLALQLTLMAAALEDGWRLRISNLIPLTLIALAFVAIVIAGPSISLWQNLVLFAVLLLVGTFLFSARFLGGGDVKLLASCGLWFDLASGWKMLVAVAICGGLLAILLLSIRPVMPAVARGRFVALQPRGGIPYGIGIAAGTAVMIWLLR